jgi:glyoxylase-like metal-dependent hydrolase (beta-lactamase superfamily II)
MHQLPADIVTIDTLHLGRSGTIACYLIRGSVPMLVDPGPAVCLPALTAALATYDLTLADIGAVLLTHIHLDHAGAIGSLLMANPQLVVYVHQRGAPHLIDPSKLLRSATRIYGDAMATLWGDFLAVPVDQMIQLAGGELITIGDQQFTDIDAPGHAIHHLIYVRQSDQVAFVGDTAGIRMTGYTYVRPATPPPDIDLEAWDATLATLRTFQPTALCLTHFGAVFDVENHLAAVQRNNWTWAQLIRGWMAAGVPDADQIGLLRAAATAEMGDEATPDGIAAYQKGASVEMSWQGLTRYWQRKIAPPA